MTLQVRSEPVDDGRPLLEILADLPADARGAFVRDGEGVVVAGTAYDVAVPRGSGRFSAARETFDQVASAAAVEDAVGLPGSGLVAVGSFAFDGAVGASSSVLRIPRIVYGRRGGTTWRTVIGDVGAAGPAPPEDVPDRSRRSDPTDLDRPRYAGSTVDDAQWLEAVARAVSAIRDGRAEKVVLARDVHLWSRDAFAIDEVLAALAARFPSCFTFLVDGLVGASPELLLRRDGPHVASRVLAGTAPRGVDPEGDARLGTALLASRKDRREHDLAARSVREALADACTELTVPDTPSLVRLDNVQHLGSDLTGTLAAGEDGGLPHVLDLLGALHPTAAVGGAPREAAMAAVADLEGMSRGRYAGPVGWCTADGDGEFAIALRCAEVRGDRARLFAGAGIVAGSLPEAELTETWLKLRAMTGVLDA